MQRFQRYDDEGWFRVGTIEVTTSVGLAAVATLSIVLGVMAPGWFRTPLDYEGGKVRAGEVWRIVTWPLVNGPSIWTILSIAMLVFVGGEIERELRRRCYAWLIGALVVLPAVATIGFELVGAAGVGYIVSPLFVFFVLWRPTTPWFFGIPLWIVVVVFETIEFLQILDLRNSLVPIGGLLTFWAVSLAVAALAARAFDVTEFHQIPKIPLPSFVTGDPYQKANRTRAKSQRKQRDSTASAGRSGGRKHRNEPAPVVPIRPEARLDRASQADMDALLDKISDSGVESLTPEERARLDELSRRLRGN